MSTVRSALDELQSTRIGAITEGLKRLHGSEVTLWYRVVGPRGTEHMEVSGRITGIRLDQGMSVQLSGGPWFDIDQDAWHFSAEDLV